MPQHWCSIARPTMQQWHLAHGCCHTCACVCMLLAGQLVGEGLPCTGLPGSCRQWAGKKWGTEGRGEQAWHAGGGEAATNIVQHCAVSTRALDLSVTVGAKAGWRVRCEGWGVLWAADLPDLEALGLQLESTEGSVAAQAQQVP